MERLPLKSEVIKDTAKEVPPYTGFGSEEDSLTSSQGLEPRAPQPDFFKFMHKDRSNFLLLTYLLSTCGLCKAYKFLYFFRQGFDSHILRFGARLVVEGQVDTHRKFVVSYYLSDDTILVTQEREQNSGREGGRFLSR